VLRDNAIERARVLIRCERFGPGDADDRAILAAARALLRAAGEPIPEPIQRYGHDDGGLVVPIPSAQPLEDIDR
jgi:hypothetical protein